MNETQMRSLLHVVDGVPVSTPPSLNEIREGSSTPSSRNRGWIVLASAASAALLLGSFVAIQSTVGGSPTPPAADSAAQDSQATMRPDLMRASPRIAVPGEYVLLRFPDKSTRGLSFTLEEEAGNSWEFRRHLASVPNGRNGEPWSPPPNSEFSVELPAITGEGPDLVAIPPGTRTGDYRICTSSSKEGFCTPVTIDEAPGLRAQRVGPDLRCLGGTVTGSDGPTESEAPRAILVCPGDASAPRLITPDDRSYDVVVAALSLPDVADISATASCASPSSSAPDVIVVTTSGYWSVSIPANGCGWPRWEVTDALDSDVPWPHRNAPLDPLTLSLAFEGRDVASSLQVKTGDSLQSELGVVNGSKATVIESGCVIGAARYGLIPLDQPDSELPFGATVDCSGDLDMEPGFSEARTGPEFRATTPQGDPLPPGQYLAVMDIHGRSDRLVYPVTVTP